MTGTRNIDELFHRRSKRKRRCTRKKCTFRIPLLGICLSSKRVKTKCKRKRRSRR